MNKRQRRTPLEIENAELREMVGTMSQALGLSYEGSSAYRYGVFAATGCHDCLFACKREGAGFPADCFLLEFKPPKEEE